MKMNRAIAPRTKRPAIFSQNLNPKSSIDLQARRRAPTRHHPFGMIEAASAARGVSLAAARIRTCLEDPGVLACDGGYAAEGPRARHLDVVSTAAQAVDRLGIDAFLHRHVSWAALARVEARRERLGVVVRRVDRGLEVEAVVDVAEEDVQRPLVLLVAPGRAESQRRLAVAGGNRRRERGARSLAGLERVRQALLEPEHLRSRAEGKAERRDHGSAPEPAATRRRRDHVPEAVDDVEVDRVATRWLADAGRNGRVGHGLGQAGVPALR